MSDWRIIGSRTDIIHGAEAVASTILSAPFKMLSGNPPTAEQSNKIYTVENIQTGEIREVVGRDEEEVGENIERGRFWS